MNTFTAERATSEAIGTDTCSAAASGRPSATGATPVALLMSIAAGEARVERLEGLQEHHLQGHRVFAVDKPAVPCACPHETAKHNRGIVVSEDRRQVRILTDPFRSTPVFAARNENGDVFVFTEFDDLASLPGVSLSADRTGFWECVLFEAPLLERTVFREVKQLGAASELVVDKTTGSFDIRRYWDFDIAEDRSIRSLDQAAEGLNAHLDRVFQRIGADTQLLIGLSGGMDSRITAAYLSRHFPKEQVASYTYGYDPRILEYQCAREVAAKLHLPETRFHRLEMESYVDALSNLALASGGMVGMQHCHMYDLIRRSATELSGCTHLSTLYSDAVFGWDAVSAPPPDDDEQTHFHHALEAVPLSTGVADEIRQDLELTLEKYNRESNFTCCEEFLYVTERNVKFHVYMMHNYRRLIPVIGPYMDLDLLQYMISVPARFRHQKRLVDAVLERQFPELTTQRTPHISSRFQWGGEFAGKAAYLHFKLMARLNAFLTAATAGRVMLLNPYVAEQPDRLLRRNFRATLRQAGDKLAERGLLTGEQRRKLSRAPLRSAGLQYRFQLLNLATIFDHFGAQ